MPSVERLFRKSEQGEIYKIPPDTSVWDALRLMSDKNIGTIAVTDEEGLFKGVVSERDFCRKVVLENKDPQKTKISEIMTPAEEAHTISRYTSIEDCLIIMHDHHIRHLPIVEQGKYLGMVSVRDLVKAIVDKNFDTIQLFDAYFKGGQT